MKIDETTGEEIELLGFGVFKDLNVFIEDHIYIKDVVFLFRSIAKVDNKTNEEVYQIFGYLKSRIPWFRNSLHGLSMEEKFERIHRLFRNTSASFCSFDEKFLAEVSF